MTIHFFWILKCRPLFSLYFTSFWILHFLIFCNLHFHIFCILHFYIFTSSHFHIFCILHLYIFTSLHFHIFCIFELLYSSVSFSVEKGEYFIYFADLIMKALGISYFIKYYQINKSFMIIPQDFSLDCMQFWNQFPCHQICTER